MDRVSFRLEQKTPVLLGQARVREAMSWTYDYDELLEHDLSWTCISRARDRSTRRVGLSPRTPDAYKQDLDKAEDLLDEAGWIDSDGDGIRDKEIDGRRVPFEFTLLHLPNGNRASSVDTAEGVPREDRHQFAT